MKVSLNDLRYYQNRYHWAGDPAPDGVQTLAEKIGGQLGAIEEVIDVGSKYNGIVIVRVMECEKLENSDHLNRCLIDDGGKVPNVERDAQGRVQIITGAPNVHAGMLGVWLPPGTTVPSTADKDPFVLEPRSMRGAVSHGMLASAKELAIGDSHEGLLEIDEDIVPGTPFAEHYGLAGDCVLDIENKMFTHRPDCFGMLGVAREIAGIQGQAFTSPDWYKTNPEFPGVETDELQLEVENQLPELVPRFVALTLRDITIKPSPLWLQISLSRLGLRPINNVVDLTNYYMLLTGQPLHAYDYDKVKALSNNEVKIIVRHPHPGESIRLINGREAGPIPESIMIATDQKLIGMAGIMGGNDTEVDENTKNIILECATFDMYVIRRTSMASGVFSDAVTRFTKGQSSLQNLAVMAKIVEDLREHAGAKVAGKAIDDNHVPAEALERSSVHAPVRVTPAFINVRLGLKLPAEEIAQLLRNVEFEVQGDGEELTVKAPFWRTDIEIPEDIVEEVGRLYGYDHLPLELPGRDLTPAPKDVLLEAKAGIRTRLARAGANEVLTYSFVHGNLLDRVGQDKAHAYQLGNALSPDLQYYRLSLTPSLLDHVHQNLKAGYGEFALFEIGKSHFKDEMDASDPAVPNEDNHVALVVAYDDKHQPAGAPYYVARKYLAQLTYLEENALIPVPLASFDLANDEWGKQLTAPYEPGRSAVFVKDGQIWGVVGEYTAKVRKALKLPAFTAGFEVHLDILTGLNKAYAPLPRFPKVTQDITLKVAADRPYLEVYSALHKAVGANAIDETNIGLELLDIFQSAENAAHKNFTFRFTIASYERTLTDAEVAGVLDQAAEALNKQLGAERV